MQRSDWSRIAHGDLEFMGPYDETSFERLLDGAALPAGARVLDLGCGKGALLRWLGVARADRRHRRRSAPGNVGRSQGYGWWPATRGRFRPSRSRSTWSARWERSATSASWPRWPGRVAWCCWATATGGKRPATTTSHALGATIDDMLDWQATLAIGAPHGLTLVRALPSSVEQWDDYEATWAANGERYAAEHPGEPGLAEFLDWIRNGRRRYTELGGRDTLGFALLLFRKGQADP